MTSPDVAQEETAQHEEVVRGDAQPSTMLLLPILAAAVIAALVASVGSILWQSRAEALRAAHVSTGNLARVLARTDGALVERGRCASDDHRAIVVPRSLE